MVGSASLSRVATTGAGTLLRRSACTAGDFHQPIGRSLRPRSSCRTNRTFTSVSLPVRVHGLAPCLATNAAAVSDPRSSIRSIHHVSRFSVHARRTRRYALRLIGMGWICGRWAFARTQFAKRGVIMTTCPHIPPHPPAASLRRVGATEHDGEAIGGWAPLADSPPFTPDVADDCRTGMVRAALRGGAHRARDLRRRWRGNMDAWEGGTGYG
jgi:hypothetical protein